MIKTWKVLTVIVVLILVVGGIIFLLKSQGGRLSKTGVASSPAIEQGGSGQMKLTSNAFENNQFIPAKYTCDGEDIVPPFSISGIPNGTKSLALIVDDPDSPSGDWVHWLVWNINPEAGEIAEGTVPDGTTEGMNDFGKVGWGGPCPHSGTHHYQFKLYALDTILNLGSSAIKRDVESAIEGHILDQAVLVGLYGEKSAIDN